MSTSLQVHKVGSHIQLEESAHKEVRDCAALSSTGRKWKFYEGLVPKKGDELNDQGQLFEQTRKFNLWRSCGGGTDFEIGAIRQCEVGQFWFCWSREAREVGFGFCWW